MYFSAIRPEGFGDRDIYYAEFMEEQKDSVLSHALFTASVKDALSQSILDATLKIYELKLNPDIVVSLTKNPFEFQL